MSASRDILDLRLSGELLLEDAKWMTCNATRIIDLYNLLIENLVKENDLTELHLLLNVSCRNPYQSCILDCLFRLELLKFRLCEKTSYSKILIDKKQLQKPVQDLLTQHGLVDTSIIIVSKDHPLSVVILINIVKSVFATFNDIFWSRLYKVKRIPSAEIVFVDTFMGQQSVGSNGDFLDRYYTGHDEYLRQCEIDKLWFAPTLANIRTFSDYKKVFANIRKCNANLLIQESWLSLYDYLISIKLSLSIPRRVFRLLPIVGHDLSQLIINESRLQIGSFSLVKAISKYIFIQRISEASIDISGAVDWNENQVVDRALNLGFKKFYPDVQVRGYQCFMVPKYYACAEPREFEKILGTLPHSYHVFGESAHAATARVRKFIDVEPSPAFRLSYLSKIQRQTVEPPIILFAMPIILGESRKLVDLLLSLLETTGADYSLVVKIHPTHSLRQFQQAVPAAKDTRIQFTSLDMSELLTSASMLVSVTSSVCAEAAALGIPVAILGNLSGPTVSPIPRVVPAHYHINCYSVNDLKTFMVSNLTAAHLESIDREIFHPNDRNGSKRLFVFEKESHS